MTLVHSFHLFLSSCSCLGGDNEKEASREWKHQPLDSIASRECKIKTYVILTHSYLCVL
ncbi:hypothetical protein MtrunA17_Chr1g0157101 [Medicago truncatula]|uniref:Transmembrane protein n=1 Tax=Medicago truncatula TaxID=3880 RepID=A0A396JMZ8_MEDTR|nr:hypothetical protein MtrunA17_Chr1g0157101 [Medicago truncatula]